MAHSVGIEPTYTGFGDRRNTQTSQECMYYVRRAGWKESVAGMKPPVLDAKPPARYPRSISEGCCMRPPHLRPRHKS